MKKKICIIKSVYNEDITNELLLGANKLLEKNDIKNVVTIYLDNSIIQLNPQLVLGKAFNTILNLIYSSKCFFF